MRNMHARTSPFGECQHTANRLDLCNRGTRSKMRQRVVTARILQVLLPPEKDGGIFGMHNGAYAKRCQLFEAL